MGRGLVGVGLIRGQRTRQYPAAREPAYRPPPRPLSRSSSRNIETTLPGSRVEGATGPPREPKDAPPPGLPREPKGAPPTVPRRAKGRAAVWTEERSDEGRRRVKSARRRAGQQSERDNTANIRWRRRRGRGWL